MKGEHKMKIFNKGVVRQIATMVILVGLLTLMATYTSQAASLSTQTGTPTALPTASGTPTALPGAITWNDQMVLIPDATDPLYKYQPPADVLNSLQTDWEDIFNNYLLAPHWAVLDRVRYLWTDKSTMLTPSSTPVKVGPGATVQTTIVNLVPTHLTYQFMGCDEQGDACLVSELLEQNFTVTYDLIKRTEIKRVANPQDYQMFGIVKWDATDGLWKLIAKSLTSRKVQYVTETPTPSP